TRNVVDRRGGAAARELVEIRLAADASAGGGQAPRNLGVLGRDAIVEYRARSRGAHTGGIDVVFQRNRDPVQRTAHVAGAPLGVERLRLRERPIAGDRAE